MLNFCVIRERSVLIPVNREISILIPVNLCARHLPPHFPTLLKSARVMGFTVFDVIVVAIAARKVLHVFLVLPVMSSSIFLFVIFFEEMKSLIDRLG